METAKKSKLREMYDALPERATTAPKTEFVNELARITKSHPTTVRAWIYGAQTPDALKQDIVSQHLGIPAEVLFN